MKTQGKIRTKNSFKYQVFELIRKDRSGGGIAIGAVNDLNPVWISEGDDDIEILVIQIEVKEFRIRCIVAYGPQENEKPERKLNFWARLSKEVEEAHENDCGIIFQMDGNLWAGEELINGDPNKSNYNGKLLKEFLKNHPHLTLVNSLDICEGKITRRRKLKHKTEESILDFFIVCEKIRIFLEKMIIDEDKVFPLSRYTKGRKIDSDHNTMVLYLNINYQMKKPYRKEFFNFKNKECQENFFSENRRIDQIIRMFPK